MDSIKYSFVPVITLGLEDCFSLYPLLNAFILFSLLLFFGKNLLRTYIFGITYLLSGIYMHWRVLIGAWDKQILNPNFVNFTQGICLVLAVICLSIGILNFIDWLRVKSIEDKDKYLVRFFHSKPGKQWKYLEVFNYVAIALLFVICAFHMVLLLATEAKDYYLVFLYSLYATREHAVFAAQSYFIYGIVIFLPATVVVMGCIYLVKNWPKKSSSISFLRYFKAGVSSVGIALSIGIMYINFI